MILHLGVIDLPYSDKESITTGDVAEILEDKYHVMETFAKFHEDEIAKALEESLTDVVDSIMAGAPVTIDPFGDGEAEIEKLFKFTFLEGKEMDGLTKGVPTKASLEGVSKRFKRHHGPPRPSFIDTSLYQQSMKAWVEE